MMMELLPAEKSLAGTALSYRVVRRISEIRRVTEG